MSKIKLCGLQKAEDIRAVNVLQPNYIGFIFTSKSKRFIEPQKAMNLKKQLHPSILAVGVFVNESPQNIAHLLDTRTIDMVQLHGNEDEDYIQTLRKLTNSPIIQAFKINNAQDVIKAQQSSAEFILLDSVQAGSGTSFDWQLINQIERPFFLAGGLGLNNIHLAITNHHPYAVDVSSGIETNGQKDVEKMTRFVNIVKNISRREL